MEDASRANGVDELLRRTRVEIAPGNFFVVGISHEDWARLLESPELSPRPNVPFMLLRDAHEVTLLLEEDDWRTMRHAARAARVEGNFRLVTLDVELPWDTIGFLARVTEILASVGVSVGALSSFSRDHLLVKQDDLAKALRALSPHVAELC
ncbi:MAG: ACT domain-containing protein [Pyrinomonadaceae bacterium]|nr:ACT domain-containing protein [Pyrinomonadaceae bacterium]